MDVLKDKTQKEYSYVSRYAPFFYNYHTLDHKYIYELTKHLSKDLPYVIVPVTLDINLDYLANKYYGRPDYFWIIADFNDIIDPFIQLSDYFSEIKIPSLGSLSFEE